MPTLKNEPVPEPLTRDVTTRISAATKERLVRLAAREDRSESWLIRTAVEQFLDRLGA